MVLINISKLRSRRSLFLILFFCCLLIAASITIALLYNHQSDTKTKSYTGLDLPKDQISYESVSPDNLKISILEEKLGTITRIKISPDGSFMLITELSGKVWIFNKQNGEFKKQEKPFYQINTGYEGFPTENGLTGLAFSADFNNDKEIFLLYAINLGKDGAKNRISKLNLDTDPHGNLIGTNEEVIFESNRDAAGAHQIQNAVGVMIQEKPHLLFTLGENYNPPDATDLTKEAGKFMLVQNNGSDPLGKRPFPNYPKITAKGIRNVYGFDIDPNDPDMRVAFLDNGPEVNDRLGFAKLIDKDGGIAGGEDFGWDGEGSSLIKKFPDLNISTNPNTILYTWDTTVSPDEIIFYPGDDLSIPKSNEEVSYALVLIFGRTGTNDNEVGKEIGYFKIDRTDTQPTAEYTPLIKRKDISNEFAGNPLGLDFDPITHEIYFGDLVEGRIYKAAPVK